MRHRPCGTDHGTDIALTQACRVQEAEAAGAVLLASNTTRRDRSLHQGEAAMTTLPPGLP